MNLRDYNGKIIRLTDIDGDVFIGFADYHDAEDNASGLSSIGIIPDDGPEGIAYGFEESEIAKIEVIPAVVSVAAFPADVRVAV